MLRKTFVSSLILGASLLSGCGNLPVVSSGLPVAGASAGQTDVNGETHGSYAIQATSPATTAIAWVTPQAQATGVKFMTYSSSAARSRVSYHVYTPPTYNQSRTQRFPVLYWLHGTGTPYQAIPFVAGTFDAAIRAGKIPPMLIVFPNGLDHGQFANSKDGKQPIETMITREILPLVDRSFRTIADRKGRIVEGFSMGGYGAARLGFKYPELFGTVSMDAAGTLDLDFSGPRARENPEERNEILRTVYGNDMAYYRACSPINITTNNVRALRGTQRVRQVIGDLDFTLSDNVAFHGHLDRLGIRHDFRTVPGVKHDCARLQAGLGEGYWSFYRDALR